MPRTCLLNLRVLLLTEYPGTPLNELRIQTTRDTVDHSSAAQVSRTAQPSRTRNTLCKSTRSPAAIYIVRNRMFFARAALNAKGKITFGLRHIRKLNRTKLSSFDR